jgi:GNAT superfamily N-acetyltransferase
MEGPRAPLDSELPNVVRFLDSHLRPEASWSVASEYPIAFAPANMRNIRIIKENDQVLSHAVLRPMIMKTPSGLFKVGAIGSVVTLEEHRHQGLSTRTIESCLKAAEEASCDFAILWTNLYDFYRRLGFELAGTELSILIDREMDLSGGAVSDPAPPLKFMDSNRIAPDPIHRLYAKHTVSSVRTLDETRRYLQIPNMRVYTAWDEHGALKAYAIEGKGADLNGYIHEWGGGVSSLIPLLAHIRKVQQRPITVIVPSHALNLIRQFEARGLLVNHGFLGMIKIVNFNSLFAKIKKQARSLGFDDLILEQKDSKFLIGNQQGIFSTDAEQDVVKLIFGPYKAAEFKGFDPAVAARLEKILPVQMWIWGWDSI